jgi:hypothetical protein
MPAYGSKSIFYGKSVILMHVGLYAFVTKHEPFTE